jgi:hypothetical protein
MEPGEPSQLITTLFVVDELMIVPPELSVHWYVLPGVFVTL